MGLLDLSSALSDFSRLVRVVLGAEVGSFAASGGRFFLRLDAGVLGAEVKGFGLWGRRFWGSGRKHPL